LNHFAVASDSDSAI